MGTMYKPQNNGPHTELAATINAGQTSITVTNASVLPEAPNVLTIGTEEDAELVEVQSITGNILTVQRGFNGTTAKAWDAGTWIYRGITAQDIEELQERTKKIVKTLTDAAFEALIAAEFAALYASGVRTVLVEQAGEEGSDTVMYRGYGLDVNGNAIPIADPDAIRKGDTVSKAEDSNRLAGVEANKYALKAPNNYVYDGVDLSTVFASAAELHAAVAAGDFSKIRVGDYWPITLNGSYTDYGDSTTKTLSNAVVKMEVAGINTYINYGDTAIEVPHLVMCSRDLLPNTTKWRTDNTTWTDTSTQNPWRGSAIYKTLNTGILPLVQETDIGAYIFDGPNGNGMCFLCETKAANATSATGWSWLDRGRLFLPTEREIWGQGVWSELFRDAGLVLQWPLFAGSLRHVVKGLGNGGSRNRWWLSSSYAGTASGACHVNYYGFADATVASSTFGIALCFLLV